MIVFLSAAVKSQSDSDMKVKVAAQNWSATFKCDRHFQWREIWMDLFSLFFILLFYFFVVVVKIHSFVKCIKFTLSLFNVTKKH